jgi:uncharacterized protein YqiB (DUF1249 family)
LGLCWRGIWGDGLPLIWVWTFALQNKICASKQDLRFKTRFALQNKICASKQDLRFKTRFALQNKICELLSAVDLPQHAHKPEENSTEQTTAAFTI